MRAFRNFLPTEIRNAGYKPEYFRYPAEKIGATEAAAEEAFAVAAESGYNVVLPGSTTRCGYIPKGTAGLITGYNVGAPYYEQALIWIYKANKKVEVFHVLKGGR